MIWRIYNHHQRVPRKKKKEKKKEHALTLYYFVNKQWSFHRTGRGIAWEKDPKKKNTKILYLDYDSFTGSKNRYLNWSSPGNCNAIWLWVEDEVPTFALPTHGLVVWIVSASCICNIWETGKVSLPVLCLRICRDLDSLTVPACAATSLAPRRPWSYLSSQRCLLFSYCLNKQAKFIMKIQNFSF
jgi:hypothetical protein